MVIFSLGLKGQLMMLSDNVKCILCSDLFFHYLVQLSCGGIAQKEVFKSKKILIRIIFAVPQIKHCQPILLS